MKALIFDIESEGWLQFSQPVAVLFAHHLSEIGPLIDQIDELAMQGKYCVGYVSYEAAPAFDSDLVCRSPGPLPLAAFGVFTESEPGQIDPGAADTPSLQPKLSFEAFDQNIGAIKHYLREGDTYQVNFTHRLRGHSEADIQTLFGQLYRAQPSPYAALLQFDDFSVCSVSPELFFEKRGDLLRTEPMKGTRPRGRTVAGDLALQKALLESEKDKAENLMIVDMIRNDLGRIAAPGSVEVDAMFSIKKLPTVWQQVSSVKARSHASLLEIFSALFPCASVTGAPKNRTMQIIAELEDSPRGVYTGAIGLVKPEARARFSVAIRTLVAEQSEVTYGVGGGIVWDSDSRDEWQESLTKGDVLRHLRPDFSLLETMRYEPGEGIWLQAEHLQRLHASATYFGYRFNRAQIEAELGAISSEYSLRLRLLLAADGSLTLEQHPLTPLPDTMTLKLADTPVHSHDIFLYHKTTHRQVYESRRRDDCDDVILYNERGELTETTISNLFLQNDGELLTPAVDAGLLAGTYREHLLGSGKAREACLVVDDLKRAEQIYIGNSVRGMIPAIVSDS